MNPFVIWELVQTFVLMTVTLLVMALLKSRVEDIERDLAKRPDQTEEAEGPPHDH